MPARVAGFLLVLAVRLGGNGMAQFKWEERFDIGVPQMNTEHRQLLHLMDALEDAMLAKKSKPEIEQAFTKLAAATVAHFREEESLMERIDFPDIAKHKIIHKNLILKLTGLKDEFSQTGSIPSTLFDFLKMWLFSHIVGIDMKYAEHSRIKKAS
jgi:hemerythrin-like metal-binding protein